MNQSPAKRILKEYKKANPIDYVAKKHIKNNTLELKHLKAAETKLRKEAKTQLRDALLGRLENDSNISPGVIQGYKAGYDQAIQDAKDITQRFFTGEETD